MKLYDSDWEQFCMLRKMIARVTNRSPNLNKILANTSWLLADRVLSMVSGAFVGVWVARYLGPQLFGHYCFAVTFVAMFGSFVGLGLDNIVVRELVLAPKQRDEILGTTFVLRSLGGALSVLLAMMSIYAMRPGDFAMQGMIAILAVASVFRGFDAIDFWFQSKLQSKLSVITRNLSGVTFCTTRLILVFTRASLIWFIWAEFANVLLNGVFAALMYQRQGLSMLQWRANLELAKTLIKSSWPLIISSLAILLYMKIDTIMLGEMVGNEAVGIYSAATKLSEVWYFIPCAIVASLFPKIVEYRSSNETIYRRRIQQLFALLSALSMGLALPLTFLSSPLVRAVYGSRYDAAGPILSVHIWASLFVFWGVAQEAVYITEGLTKLTMLRTVGGGVINVLLNLWLIPRYQGLGAAIATVVAYSFTTIFGNALSTRTRYMCTIQFRSLLFPLYFR